MKHRSEPMRAARLLAGAVLVTVLFDLPFRLIELLGLIPAAGPKNMLPVLFGLLCGPVGAVGAGLGMLLASVLVQEAALEVLVEAVAAAAAGMAAGAVWYLMPVRTRVRCKTRTDVLTVVLCIAAASLAAAAVVACVPGPLWACSAGSRAAQVGASTTVWSLLLGIPCLITATSMFGIKPAAPHGWLMRHADCDPVDLEHTVLNKTDSIAEMCDAVDMLTRTRGLEQKQGYALMSCVEELSCLILAQLPEDGRLEMQLTISDSLMVRMRYAGARYNPLAIRMQPGGPLANMDTLGILLVREMAVYAKHRYEQAVNEIRIII